MYNFVDVLVKDSQIFSDVVIKSYNQTYLRLLPMLASFRQLSRSSRYFCSRTTGLSNLVVCIVCFSSFTSHRRPFDLWKSTKLSRLTSLTCLLAGSALNGRQRGSSLRLTSINWRLSIHKYDNCYHNLQF